MVLHKEDREFLHKCLDILDKDGVDSNDLIILGRECEGTVYSDDVITIQKSNDDLWMEIIRMYNNNAVFYMHDGITIRFNNEYVYLEDHVNKLLTSE
jgi:hypothetical protein